MDSSALIIFARSPAPAKTKTRLIPALGPIGAAELYRCFLLDIFTTLTGLPAALFAAAAAPEDASTLAEIAAPSGAPLHLTIQSGSDLGERLAIATERAFDLGHSPVAVIGTDAPTLPRSLIETAFLLSAHHDLVLGPSFDGGYYLISLRTAAPKVFEKIAWSEPSVLRQTLANAERLALSTTLLEPWYDVDTPKDLAFLKAHLQSLRARGIPLPCPHTANYLSRLAEHPK